MPDGALRPSTDPASGCPAMAGRNVPRHDDDHGDHLAGGLDRCLARKPQTAMDHPLVGALVCRSHGRHARRVRARGTLLRRRSELPRERWQARPQIGNGWRCAGGSDDHPIGGGAISRQALRFPLMQMDGFEVLDPRFAHCLLGTARLEQLAGGFRWIEGLVWMGDANCLLFQDLPRNRTMRWIEDSGISVYRE